MKNPFIDNIGNTPLMQMNHLSSNIYAKAEFFNPGGSIKDRIAKEMILSAMDRGEIENDSVIIEATSGNTGIGLAAVCASLGLKLIIVMPESMSIERRKIISHYGAELILTEASGGMRATIERVEELKQRYPKHFLPSQFSNIDNPNAHYKTTAPEIYEQMNEDIDIFVAAVGTGGTITGVGWYLKEKSSDIKIVAIEPEGSPFLSKGIAGTHTIQGIGAGFKPDILDLSIIDEIEIVQDKEAIEYARDCAKSLGLAVGISAGANLAIADRLAKRYPDKKIVTILPDSAERYISTKLFR